MTGFTETLRRNRILIFILLVLLLLLLMATRSMSAKDWVITVLRGLSVGAVTFLVASGFSIILGLMDVLNLAHGTLFMIGAYVGWTAYVRPDTVVDLATPLALIVAGFLLLPLFTALLGRVKMSPTAARIWPWIGLLLALGLLALSLTRLPIAMWDAEVFDDSPITWSQIFDAGTLLDLVQPATAAAGAPALLIFAGLLAGSALTAFSIAGLRRQRRAASAVLKPGAARRTAVVVALLVVLGLVLFALNTPLTATLLGLNSTVKFIFAILVGTLTGAALGGLMESTLIRPLYERPIYQILLTFGLAFIGTELVRAVWGRTNFTMPRPAIFAGTGDGCPATTVTDWWQHQCSTLMVEIAGESARIRVYNELFLPLAGLVVLVVVWLILQRTRLGMIIRAGVQDDEMVEALGINVRRVFTQVFALGVGLAALGGVLAAPSMGLSEGMGATALLAALIALAIGGLTSFPGAAAGSVIVGLLQQFVIKYGQVGIPLPFLDEPFKPTPPLVPASAVLLMIVVLLILPQGLFGRRE